MFAQVAAPLHGRYPRPLVRVFVALTLCFLASCNRAATDLEGLNAIIVGQVVAEGGLTPVAGADVRIQFKLAGCFSTFINSEAVRVTAANGQYRSVLTAGQVGSGGCLRILIDAAGFVPDTTDVAAAEIPFESTFAPADSLYLTSILQPVMPRLVSQVP